MESPRAVLPAHALPGGHVLQQTELSLHVIIITNIVPNKIPPSLFRGSIFFFSFNSYAFIVELPPVEPATAEA